MSAIKLAVSSCLLGHQVRFDGGHKKVPFITQLLAKEFELVPICPEVAIGLGVPRQTLCLVGNVDNPSVIGNCDASLDVSSRLRVYGQEMAQKLSEICGYIVKKDSPSCGMERVRVYDDKQMPQRQGRGVYIATLMEQMPWLPVEEEGRLNDPVLWENFFERVFIVHRWRLIEKEGISAAALVKFHSEHKYMIMSRGQHEYRRLGRMVAQAGCEDIKVLSRAYFLSLMQVLKKNTSKGRHVDVMFHLLGYFKKSLSADDKQEVISLIENYHQGILPLVVPLTLMRHHLKQVSDQYLQSQHYFSPYPERLMLRDLCTRDDFRSSKVKTIEKTGFTGVNEAFEAVLSDAGAENMNCVKVSLSDLV